MFKQSFSVLKHPYYIFLPYGYVWPNFRLIHTISELSYVLTSKLSIKFKFRDKLNRLRLPINP